jgi:membrane associated rhomboid family serine protease
MIAYSVDVPMARLPVANWMLIAVTCLVSIAAWCGFGLRPEPSTGAIHDFVRPAVERASRIPGALDPARFSVYQLITSLLVHGDVVHLLGNMYFLFCFGNAVNAKLGHALFLACYFLIGAFEGCVWLLLGTGQPVVGASGAIMGVVGIFVLLFPRNNLDVFWFEFPFFLFTFSLSAGWVVLFYFLSDLIGSIYGVGGGIAYVCHLAGALGGVAVGALLIVTGLAKPPPYEENLFQVLGWMPRRETDSTLRREARRALKRRRKNLRASE